MNWFNILKDAKTMQGQRQGFRLDDKDEDYVLEDESDCYDEFVAMTERVMASFPNGSKIQENRSSVEFEYDEFIIGVKYYIEEKGKIPDEVYCAAIEEFKKLRPPSGNIPFHLGKYFIRCDKKGNFYNILITEREGANIDHVLSNMQVILSNKDPDSRENEYKLHLEFDNWRGFF